MESQDTPRYRRVLLKLSGEALEAAQKKANEKILSHWKIEGDVLINDGKGGNLATVKDYADFELHVDWRIEPMGFFDSRPGRVRARVIHENQFNTPPLPRHGRCYFFRQR